MTLTTVPHNVSKREAERNELLGDVFLKTNYLTLPSGRAHWI